MTDETETLVANLFSAFNRREAPRVRALCHPAIELVLPTGRLAGSDMPYRGHAGLRRYLTDVSRIWEELLASPRDIRCSEGEVLVTGRIFSRSSELGIRDLPAAWTVRIEDRLVTSVEHFDDVADATADLGWLVPDAETDPG